MEKCHHSEVQFVQYIELNREAVSLHTEKQGDRVRGIQLDEGARFR